MLKGPTWSWLYGTNVVVFTIAYAISAYHHWRCKFESLSAGRWFSLGTAVFSINKTDVHDITEILLKVALNTTTLTLYYWDWEYIFNCILTYSTNSPRNKILNLLVWIKFWNSFYIYIYLNKNWEIHWSDQSFTGLGPEDWCSSWGLYTCWIDLRIDRPLIFLFVENLIYAWRDIISCMILIFVVLCSTKDELLPWWLSKQTKWCVMSYWIKTFYLVWAT